MALFGGLAMPFQRLGRILGNALAQTVEHAQFCLGQHDSLLGCLGELVERHAFNQIIAGAGVLCGRCFGSIERITVAFIDSQFCRTIGRLVDQEQGLDVIPLDSLAR